MLTHVRRLFAQAHRYSLRSSLRTSLVPRSMLTPVRRLFAQALIVTRSAPGSCLARCSLMFDDSSRKLIVTRSAPRSAPRSYLARCSLMFDDSSRKRSSLLAPLLARASLDAHSCSTTLRASAHRYSLRSVLVGSTQPRSMLTHVLPLLGTSWCTTGYPHCPHSCPQLCAPDTVSRRVHGTGSSLPSITR